MGAFSFFFFFFFFLLSCCSTLFLSPALPGPAVSVTPNFTASHLKFIAASGAFLASRDNSFEARITNPQPESTSFYLVIIHAPSGTVVWSANRNNPISHSSQLLFTATGLSLLDDSGRPIWSTPPASSSSSLSSLQLTESGNLVLLDVTNTTVWESFDYPTDVLVPGQRLRVGQTLVSSEGSYRLAVGDGDAMLQWNEMSYWKLSMHKNAFRDTDFPVEYMLMNSTGLYLMSNEGQNVVIKVILPDINDNSSSSFPIMKLDHEGLLTIKDDGGSAEQGFAAPDDRCRIPFICRRLGVCANGGACQCAPAFHTHSKISASGGDCVPSDGSSLALPSAGPCNAQQVVTYLNLINGLDYFSNDFTDPEMRSVNLSACQGLCSTNCSCLGVFYSQGSGSCYMIRDFLGSVLIKSSSDRSGYIKTTTAGGYNHLEKKKEADLRRHLLTVVLLPSAMFVVAALIATLVCSARRKMMRWGDIEDEMDLVSIPGLPVRMDYEELAEATQGFGTQIGSGGFGTVYKGTLAKDGTEVAVKKMTCLGKREFLTEIAVIGKIRHVNLVRLRGFCVHGPQKFIVYEYMKRGSLDRTLFGEPVLGWKERCEIALGTARGLAYLHWGCEHKILHCDIKPENILLHGESQVRISDFGLSKLLSTEQSGLFTTLRGTRGYLAPEWLTRASISDRTDVYSYGMVLLEMIRGKKNSAPHEHGSRVVYFPLFALEMHEAGRYLDLVDPRLAGRVGREEAEKLVRVALCCVHEEPGLRPSMTSVVGMLEGGVALGEPRMESLSFLRLYGRRFTEDSMLGSNDHDDDELMMMNATAAAAAAAINNVSPHHSFSYVSSHQVSGPR